MKGFAKIILSLVVLNTGHALEQSRSNLTELVMRIAKELGSNTKVVSELEFEQIAKLAYKMTFADDSLIDYKITNDDFLASISKIFSYDKKVFIKHSADLDAYTSIVGLLDKVFWLKKYKIEEAKPIVRTQIALLLRLDVEAENLKSDGASKKSAVLDNTANSLHAPQDAKSVQVLREKSFRYVNLISAQEISFMRLSITLTKLGMKTAGEKKTFLIENGLPSDSCDRYLQLHTSK